MIVIGDSSVFINFALVGEFNCLKYIAPICVPEAVYNEVYSI
jgi:predicted nucleic acid-binding protein